MSHDTIKHSLPTNNQPAIQLPPILKNYNNDLFLPFFHYNDVGITMTVIENGKASRELSEKFLI